MSESGIAPVVQGVLQQLGGMVGQPVRVTVMAPDSRERMVRLTGVLSAAEHTGLLIDCLDSVPPLPAEAPVTFEVMVGGNLYWCHTNLTPGKAARTTLQLQVPSSIQTQQRRRHPRVDLDVPVRLAFKGGNVVPATLRDLSASGASLRSAVALRPGDQAVLVFALGSGLFFQDLPVEVVRSVESTEGVHIVAVRFMCTTQQEATLAGWVNAQLATVASN